MNISCYNSIPGNIVAYWVSKNFINIFSKCSSLINYCDAKQGLATGNNNLFLRYWFEVDSNTEYFGATDSISAFYTGKKWFPYNKGGEYNKWYGNQDFVINWSCDGKDIKNYTKDGKIASVIRSPQYYFNECLSWSKICSSSISFRYYPKGFIFDVAGCSIFAEDKETLYYLFGILNSNVTKYILSVLAPTINYEVGQISVLPIINNVNLCDSTKIVNNNILLKKKEYDSFETSWDFKKHPLI